MIDREKVLTVLRKRFPGAATQQVAAAANAIVGLDEEWEEVTDRQDDFGYHVSAQCPDICYLASEIERGAEIRVFKRKGS